MIELDGSGGGGQLVRTALSLSALTGRSFHMRGIRERRPNPGLRPQHLAAVRAVASITDAEVSSVDVGAPELRFEPGPVRPGRYEVDVGTAGCIILVFDAVLPLARDLDDGLVLRATGGTDVRWAPTFDYFRRVKLPLLRRHGLAAAVDLTRRGFYPVGGGEATLSLAPSTLDSVVLDKPGTPVSARVYSVATTELADSEVAERQASTAVDGLEAAGIDVASHVVEYTEAASPGSALTVRFDRGRSIAGVDALGERGKPAETVATEATDQARELHQNAAAVDRHLADQLLVFLAIAGGRFTIPSVTEHVETSRPLLEAFGYDVEIDRTGPSPILKA